MPIKNNIFCVYDLETTGKDPNTVQPIQIACQMYNSRSLEPIPNASFCSYCKPTDDCIIDSEVWNITKIDPKVIETAISIEIVWPKFVEFVLKYNPKKDEWNAPISVGHNIDRYDSIIVKNMNTRFGPKKEKTVLFNKFISIDSMKLLYPLFENSNEVGSYKLTEFCKFFGLDNENAHKADTDVHNSGQIAMRMLKFYRSVAKEYVPLMRNAFKTKSVKDIELEREINGGE